MTDAVYFRRINKCPKLYGQETWNWMHVQNAPEGQRIQAAVGHSLESSLADGHMYAASLKVEGHAL
jgi:hypothetical protein